MNHEGSYCPTCYKRDGPLHAFGLLYWWCMTHRYRWTTAARFRELDPAALHAVRAVCQKTTLVVHSSPQRHDQGPLSTPVPATAGRAKKEIDHVRSR